MLEDKHTDRTLVKNRISKLSIFLDLCPFHFGLETIRCSNSNQRKCMETTEVHPCSRGMPGSLGAQEPDTWQPRASIPKQLFFCLFVCFCFVFMTRLLDRSNSGGRKKLFEFTFSGKFSLL